jgi:hypothetical protein
MAAKAKLALPGGNTVKCLTAACALLLSASLLAQYDDASTEEVNEGCGSRARLAPTPGAGGRLAA